MRSDFYQHFNSGDHLFRQGEIGDAAYIIEKGLVEIYIEKSGKRVIIANLSEGDLLGEMAIIDQAPRNASAMAVQATDVIAIPLSYIQQKIDYSDATVRFFMQVLMTRYRDIYARLMHVIEGINPNASNYESLNDSTSDQIKSIMHQYLEMQDRILNAVNTSAILHDKNPDLTDLRHTRRDLSIEKSLQLALQQDQFVLYYQPIVDLSSGQISGCEALVRWQHPEQGFQTPELFIPHCENSGLIIELGYLIAEQACRFQKFIADSFKPDFFTSINLSIKQFDDQDLIARLVSIVDAEASLPDLIKFEITESLLMSNPEQMHAALTELRQNGIKLVIDDFGTGYSSLSYLHRFPFDSLKIDKSFVSTILHNKKSEAIVKSLVNLGHNLGMNLIAEGIETGYEEDLIKQYQVELGQGYLYGTPLSAEEFQKLLE